MCSKPYDFDGFVGDFKELMIQFVQMKQSLGFDYVEEANALRRFSKFTLNYTIKDHALTKNWLMRGPKRDQTNRMLHGRNVSTI
jgi:hypothetical protein